MQQFNQIKNWRRSSQQFKSQDPVLTAEDERFLQNIVTERSHKSSSSVSPAEEDGGVHSPVSPLGIDVPNLQSPVSPEEEFGRELGEEGRKTRELSRRKSSISSLSPSSKVGVSPPTKKPWNWLRRMGTVSQKNKGEAATSGTPSDTQGQLAATGNDEVKQEAEDMTEVLERLDLAADNNRVFSISDETQELLRKFKLIFKDLVDGVPTAYHDLEMLLTNGNRQLQSTYTKLPSFLQKLIEKLPERWTETLAPEMIAAASERAGTSGINMDNVEKVAAAAGKMGIKVPSLKELVGKPAALVGMLRSIVAFLRARFPAVLGMNILWSLALFILLFVLWYCHKRGREVRLENERLVSEEEIEKLNEQSSSDEGIRTTETLTTTAPQGASVAEVREGIKEAQQSRESNTSAPVDGQTRREEETMSYRSPSKPSRSKSILAIWGRSGQRAATASVPKIEPYPGT